MTLLSNTVAVSSQRCQHYRGILDVVHGPSRSGRVFAEGCYSTVLQHWRDFLAWCCFREHRCAYLHLLVVPAGNWISPYPDSRLTEKASYGPWGCQPLRPIFVGSEQNNMPRISITNTAESSVSADQQNPLNNPPSPNLPYTCGLCSRIFTTKVGLSIHQRRAHPNESDQANIRIEKKPRWSNEEASIMARLEADLLLENPECNINQELSRRSPKRSLEAIKKQRQKQSYKELVLTFKSQSSGSSTSNNINHDPGDDDHLIQYISSLPILEENSYNTNRLQEIINNALLCGKDASFQRLASYLFEVFPPNRRRNVTVRSTAGRSSSRPLSRRKQRRMEFAQTQRNWQKHQSRCIKTILDGGQNSIVPDHNIMTPYWKQVMEGRSVADLPIDNSLAQPLAAMWSPITVEDLKKSRPSLGTSPGHDGISSKQYRAIPDGIKARILNLIMWCGRWPEHLRTSRTIFIPKKPTASTPDEFRPITIPSIFMRQLHNVLSTRLINLLSLDPRQKAFQSCDGCSNNIMLLDLILNNARIYSKSCYIASLDIGKAFDSVSHSTILNTAISFGLPKEFCGYLNELYKSSSTAFVVGGAQSDLIHPTRGVKQGDPLSPILFIMVIDRLLKKLPGYIGYSLGATTINALAFADDLLLFSTTPEGLQTLLEETNKFISKCSMTLNINKCVTISIKGHPKQKTSTIENRRFTICGQTLPCLKRTDKFKYLGIEFTPDGRCKYALDDDLILKLDRLTKAPLKPQQRLHALRTVLIPQLYYKLTLGNVMVGSLRKTDVKIRTYIRKWLNIPKDACTAFFHAKVSNGGLGIPSLRWTAPLQRLSRIKDITQSMFPGLGIPTEDGYMEKLRNQVLKRLCIDDTTLDTQKKIDEHWAKSLYSSIDGYGLREAPKVPAAHRWVHEPTKLLSGRDFINNLRLRINALPVRSRTSWGRHDLIRSCRAGCAVPETLNHVVQQCSRTHGMRIIRHNYLVSYLKRNMSNLGYTAYLEPHISTRLGLRKPDLVATKDQAALIIDAQVVGDSVVLDDAHERKIAYYRTDEIINLVKERYDVNAVQFTTITLSYRGIWSSESANDLMNLNLIKKSEAALISLRTMAGSIRCFRCFNTCTMMRPREGIG